MQGEQVDDASYRVQMTDEAVYAYAAIPSDSVYRRIGELLRLLERFPHYGQVYDPYYEAKRPPVPCRVFFCGSYGVYHRVDEAAQVVTILAIEDERRDPRTRFATHED